MRHSPHGHASVDRDRLRSQRPLARRRPTRAQTYPNRPVEDRSCRFRPAGRPTFWRAWSSQRLSEVWGQPVVVENQPGANTAIAAARVAKMPADGYTLLAAMDVTMVLNPLTSKKLSYEPLKDFAPISLAAKNTSLLTVRAADGPATVAELIARAKANPGKINYGAGIITTRLAGYLFNREAGIDVQYIPYNGSAPTVQGLLTGAVDYIVDGTASHISLIKSGQLRALAKLNSRPLPALPDVRTARNRERLIRRSTTSRPGSGLLRPPACPAPSPKKFSARSRPCTRTRRSPRRLQKSGISAGQLDAGRIRRIRAQGDRPLGQGLQGQRHHAQLIEGTGSLT